MYNKFKLYDCTKALNADSPVSCCWQSWNLRSWRGCCHQLEHLDCMHGKESPCRMPKWLSLVSYNLTSYTNTCVFGWSKKRGMVSAAPGNDWPMNSSLSFFLLWVMAFLSRPICFDISEDLISRIAKSQRVRKCSSCLEISSSISPGAKFSMF